MMFEIRYLKLFSSRTEINDTFVTFKHYSHSMSKIREIGLMFTCAYAPINRFRGPFLESPGNFSGPELDFKIKLYGTLA